MGIIFNERTTDSVPKIVYTLPFEFKHQEVFWINICKPNTINLINKNIE